MRHLAGSGDRRRQCRATAQLFPGGGVCSELDPELERVDVLLPDSHHVDLRLHLMTEVHSLLVTLLRADELSSETVALFAAAFPARYQYRSCRHVPIITSTSVGVKVHECSAA